MNYAGLSLAQTPPLAVPLRFFLTAPLFAAAAGLLLLLAGPSALVTRWSAPVLAAAHLLTLGFLAMVMFGAVQQLLPVLMGSPVPRPQVVSRLVHGLTAAGTALLAGGLLVESPWSLRAAAVLLGAGVGLFVAVAGYCLARARSAHATVAAMALALAGLLVTALFGLHLLGGHAWGQPLARQLTDVHLAWGLLGWVAMLVVGVAYQVVPMFQITPDYPRPLVRLLAPGLCAALLVWSAGRLLASAPLTALGGTLGALGLALFALATLRLQSRRRRRLPDVTLDFWRVAMACLGAAVVAWGAGHLIGRMPELLLGLLLVVGFGLSAVCGMLYKIVAFLIWLHLNNRMQEAGQWQGTIPHMKQIIPERHTRRQFALHLAALLLLAAATVWPWPLVWPAGLALLLSMGYLEWNLLAAVRLYRRVAAGYSPA